MGAEMNIMDWVTLLAAAVVGGHVIHKRKLLFRQHDWKIALFHVLLVAMCAAAVTDAWHGHAGFSILGVAATVLWIRISRSTWPGGQPPEYFQRRKR